MGKPIVYCGDCGTSLREQDFEKGRAHEIDRQPYCADCRPPSAVSAAAVSTRQAPPRISTAHIPRLGTTRRVSRRRSSAPLVAAGGVLAAVGLLIAVVSAPSDPPPAAPPAAPAAVRLPAPPPPPPPPPRPAPPPPPRDTPVPEPAPAIAPPSVALDRWLDDVREIRKQDPDHRRAAEVRSLLRNAAEIAGPRRTEVEAILADYEKSLAAPPPPPPPPPAAVKPAPRITVTYTLINADTEQPVPGFDPLLPEAVVDLSRIGTRKIDVRINVSGKIGSLKTQINSGKTKIENGPPYSFTSNSVAGGYTGWTPTPGPQVLTITPYSESSAKGTAGETFTFRFTVVDRSPSPN